MLFDKDEISTLETKKFLESRKHPTFPLTVYHYTDRCAHKSGWDIRTSLFRSLVYDFKNEKVIAYPFPKFFDHADKHAPRFSKSVRVDAFEKLDGSLGVIWHYDKAWHVNTSVSFVGPQAVEAKKMLEELYSEELGKLRPDWTYLVEIVFPGNKVVVDYGKRRALVLLGAFETASGREVSEKALGDLLFPRPKIHRGVTLKELEEIMEKEEAEQQKVKQGKVLAEGYIVVIPVGAVESAPDWTYSNQGRLWKDIKACSSSSSSTSTCSSGSSSTSSSSTSAGSVEYFPECMRVKVKHSLYTQVHRLGSHGGDTHVINLLRKGRGDLLTGFASDTLGKSSVSKQDEKVKEKDKEKDKEKGKPDLQEKLREYTKKFQEIRTLSRTLCDEAKALKLTTKDFALKYAKHQYKAVLLAEFRGSKETEIKDRIYGALLVQIKAKAKVP